MKARPVWVSWTVNGKTVHEQRVSDESPEALGKRLWALRSRDYPMEDVIVDDQPIPRP